MNTSPSIDLPEELRIKLGALRPLFRSNLEEGIQQAEALFEDDESSSTKKYVMSFIASRCLRKGEFELAREWVERALTGAPADPDLHRQLIVVLHRTNRFSEAKKVARRLLDLPNVLEELQDDTRAYLKGEMQGHYVSCTDRASDEMARAGGDRKLRLAYEALEKDPDSLPALVTIADMELGRGNCEVALRYAERALAAERRSLQGVIVKGACLLRMKKFSNAYAALKCETGRNVNLDGLFICAALETAHRDEAMEIAKALYEKCASEQKTSIPAAILLGYDGVFRCDYVAAKSYFDLLLSHAHVPAEGVFRLTILAFEEGDFESAGRYAEYLKRSKAGNARVRIVDALLTAMGKPEGLARLRPKLLTILRACKSRDLKEGLAFLFDATKAIPSSVLLAELEGQRKQEKYRGLSTKQMEIRTSRYWEQAHRLLPLNAIAARVLK